MIDAEEIENQFGKQHISWLKYKWAKILKAFVPILSISVFMLSLTFPPKHFYWLGNFATPAPKAWSDGEHFMTVSDNCTSVTACLEMLFRIEVMQTTGRRIMQLDMILSNWTQYFTMWTFWQPRIHYSQDGNKNWTFKQAWHTQATMCLIFVYESLAGPS